MLRFLDFLIYLFSALGIEFEAGCTSDFLLPADVYLVLFSIFLEEIWLKLFSVWLQR